VQEALRELGVEREQVEVEVLEEPNRGFLGWLGARMAEVKVTVKVTKSQFAREFLKQVTNALGIEMRVSEVGRSDRYVFLELEGEEAGLLIGRRGETLNALQYLVNVAASRVSQEPYRIVLDVDGYRKRRHEALERLARRVAERVRRTGRKMVLEPMPARERRVVHLALQNQSGVTTHSEGQEPYRRVVVSPSK